MAAFGYMDEGKVESIWDSTWDTTRFNHINLRIARLLNIIFNSDAESNVTNTAVVPYLEQLSEEILVDLRLSAKAEKFVDTWGFIQANVSNFFVKKINQNRWMIDMVLKILGKTETVELVSISGFGSSSDL